VISVTRFGNCSPIWLLLKAHFHYLTDGAEQKGEIFGLFLTKQFFTFSTKLAVLKNGLLKVYLSFKSGLMKTLWVFMFSFHVDILLFWFGNCLGYFF
jgi:hypothetical protein